MDQILLYCSFTLAFFTFFMCLIAYAHLGKIQKATKDLTWSEVANITGDLSTIKKSIQTLNNRINGLHSPKLEETALLAQLMQAQQQPVQQKNGKLSG